MPINNFKTIIITIPDELRDHKEVCLSKTRHLAHLQNYQHDYDLRKFTRTKIHLMYFSGFFGDFFFRQRRRPIVFQSQKSSSAGKSNLITLTIWHKKLAFLHTWWWSSSWVLVVIRPCFNRNHIPKPLFFSLCLFLQDLRDSWDGVFLISQPEKVTLLVCVCFVHWFFFCLDY